jgi:hypothetical protein
MCRKIEIMKIEIRRIAKYFLIILFFELRFL